jgi:hypothetical protein
VPVQLASGASWQIEKALICNPQQNPKPEKLKAPIVVANQNASKEPVVVVESAKATSIGTADVLVVDDIIMVR